MNFITKAILFFKESYYELAKVAWLGKREAVATTIVIIFFILIMSLFVSLVDLALGKIIEIIL
ncbi:MAG: preprotein translocase subunit SecE [Elusimicrobiota bacterium]|jgi:preprotein translocase subunit SecE|nr:preprotein translocase subunit SecE [Elusimicrobiota bacterium]